MKFTKKGTKPSPLPDSVAQAIAVREFIYLDEVSVYSLASAAGQPMLVGEVEVMGQTLANKTQVKAGLTTPVGGIGSKFDTEEGFANSFQIESKYNVQSTFAALRDLIASQTLLRESARSTPSPPSTLNELAAALPDLRTAGAAVAVTDLTRGAVVEVPVELVPHDSFTVRTVMREMQAMSEAAPGALDLPTGDLTLRQVSELTDWLLGDVVPIQGRATRHELVDIGGVSWIVESRLLSNVRLGGPGDSKRPPGTQQAADIGE